MSDAVRIKYNMACCESLLGNVDVAMNLLLEIESEWNMWDHILTDIDVDALRERDDFKELMRRHESECHTPEPIETCCAAA
jgi:hypothetical protein